MEPPSAVSSNAHTPQHVDRRNEPAPQVATYNNSETRQKIIEILASTANGCLAELGYFPGMPHKLKELELQNKNWQTENVKLFEDNKRLMTMLNSQTESLKWVKVPDMEKIQRIKDLEQENHALRIQREELLRRSIAEGSQSHQQGQMPYAQLQYEHSNLLETYRLAYNEVQRLRASIVHNPQLHQQEPIRIEQRHPTTSQNLSQFPMPVAAQVPHQALVQAPQQVTTPSPVTNLPMLQPTMQGRRHDLAHSQNAVIQRRQQQTVRMHRHAASGTIIIPPKPIQPAQTQPARSPIQPSSQGMPMQGEDPLIMMENNIRASKRGGNKYPNMPPPQLAPSRSGSSPASPMGFAPSPPIRSPLSGQPINAQFHSVPTNMNPQASSVRSPSTTSPKSMAPTPLTSAEPHVVPITPVVSSYDTYPNQQPGLTSPLPSPVIVSPQNVSVPSNQSEPLSAPTPVPPPAASLKRDSISDEGVAELTEEPNKKPRLEQSCLEPSPIDSAAGPSPAPLLEPPTEVPTPVSEVQEAMEVDGGAEQEGSEDEMVEIGPDGLRLVKDCLEEIFHEPKEDGSVICKLCEYRHTHGYQEEPPIQFVNPTDQQLEDHCVAEHEAAWSNLRNPDAE